MLNTAYMSIPPPRPRRWPRSELFRLSERGQQAAQAYLDAIVASREEGGRRSFDDARLAWAVERDVKPEEGLTLREFVDGPLSLIECTARLQGCGPDKKSLQASLLRLIERDLVEPVPSD